MEYNNNEDKSFIKKDLLPKFSLVWQSWRHTKANEAISHLKRMDKKDE